MIVFDRPVDNQNIIGTGNIKLIDKTNKKFWIEETGIKINSSYEFNEESIITSIKIKEKIIILNKQNNFSIIENIILLTKKINYHFCPLKDKKWIFGQIILNRKFPDYYNKIFVVLENLKYNSFSQNKIVIDDIVYGKINFIVANP